MVLVANFKSKNFERNISRSDRFAKHYSCLTQRRQRILFRKTIVGQPQQLRLHRLRPWRFCDQDGLSVCFYYYIARSAALFLKRKQFVSFNKQMLRECHIWKHSNKERIEKEKTRKCNGRPPGKYFVMYLGDLRETSRVSGATFR